MNIALVDRQRIRAVFMFRADNSNTTTIVSLYDRAVPLDNTTVSTAADSQKISMNHPLTVNRPISTAINNRLQSLGIAASDYTDYRIHNNYNTTPFSVLHCHKDCFAPYNFTCSLLCDAVYVDYL